MSTDCYDDILQNSSGHYDHCRPIITECEWYWYIFVLSMLCIQCTYVPVLFCISSISTVPNSDGKIRVPFTSQEDTLQGDWVTCLRFWKALAERIPLGELFVLWRFGCYISNPLSFAMGFGLKQILTWGISKGPASGRCGWDSDIKCCTKSSEVKSERSCCKKSDWMMLFPYVIRMYHSHCWNLLLGKFKAQPEKWVDMIIFASDLHCLWQVLGSTQQGTQHRWARWRAAYPLHLSRRFEPCRRCQIYPSTAAIRQQTLAAFTPMNLSSSSVKSWRCSWK